MRGTSSPVVVSASPASGVDARARVLRNGSINFAGAVAPLLIGVVAMPAIVRGLGVDRFGILSFAWAILGYFTLFDLGLGRATTMFAASMVGSGRTAELPRLAWTSLVLSVALGLVGTTVLAVLTPALVGRLLHLGPDLAVQTSLVFLLVAATLPAVLVSNTLRGVLEAHQRFGLVNMVTIPTSAAMFVLPVVGVAVGFELPGIVALLAASRVAAAVAFLCLCLVVVPAMRGERRVDRRIARPLLAYGGWVTLSNMVGSSLTYLDRFAIGAVLTSAAVGYYTAPYDTVTRLWVIPSSIVNALFPAVSASAARGEHATVKNLAGPSMKYLLLAVGPVAVVLIVWAPEILTIWLGADFARHSALVFRLLAAGVLINCVAFVPFSVLQAIGRADLPPKLYVVELVLYVPLLFVLLTRFGIAGAAAAWTTRVAIDCVAMSAACGAAFPMFWESLRSHRVLGAAAAVVTVGTGAAVARGLVAGTIPQISAIAMLLAAFAAGSWTGLLDEAERRQFTRVAFAWRH